MGQRGGELHEALSADEVGVEGRAARVAAPADAGSFEAAAMNESVVHGDDEGSVGGEGGESALADGGEQVCGLEAGAGEEAIGGGPVETGLAGGLDPAGEMMAAEAGEAAQPEPEESFRDAGLAAGEGLGEERVELIEEAGPGVFFRGEGGVWGRLRTSWERSSTAHSTTSPGAKSMA